MDAIFLQEGDHVLLEYDSSDGWEFEITAEKLSPQCGKNRIMGGQGFGIFDDMGGIGALNSLLHVHPELRKKLTSEQIDRIARRVNSDEFLKFASKGTPFGQKLFPAEEFVSFESKEYLDWHQLHESAVIKHVASSPVA